MNQPNKKNAFGRIMLTVYGAFSVLCLSAATVLYVNAAGISYDGVNDKTETVYDINFVQSGNQSDDVNRIYVTGTDTSSTVVVSSGTIISQYYDYNDGGEIFGNVNAATGYSQILGGSGININSDNVTVLGGNTNVVEVGNDNLTILGGRGNTILGGSNGGSPVVVVGGSGNQVGISQDGTIIIGGGANVMSGGVANAQILGGERNEVGADNVTVAGTNVKNNMSNTFVFSDGDMGMPFVPSTPNAFYINSANGLGLNSEFSGAGVSSAGGIYVGGVNIDTMDCNAERIGIQGTAQGGCLVGCTQASSENNRWELLGTSEMCVEWCKRNEKCENPLEIEYEDIPSYCIGTVVAGAEHCSSLNTSDYSNSVFMVDFVNVCPSNPAEVSNPCTYKCPEGYSSANGCKKDCTFGSGSSKITLHHGESVTGYIYSTRSCSGSSNDNPNPCDVIDASYQVRTCDNGKLLGSELYHNISCMSQGVDCGEEYNLTAKTESGGVYLTCTGYVAGNNICTQNLRYKLTGCASGYSYVKVGENYRCYPDCTFNGKTVHYGESVTGYSSTSVTCVGNSTYCDSRKLTCQSDGTFGSEGLVYSSTGCHVSEVVPPAYYNLAECPKANVSQGTTTNANTGNKINAGVQIGICESFTGYHVNNNTCSAYMRYHLTGCIAGYTQSGDNCLPNCILPWSTGNLQYGVNNSAWSSQSIIRGATITGYKYQTRNCSGDWCDKLGNRAIMKCNAAGVLSGFSTYKYQSCKTQPLVNLTGYCRTTPLDNSVRNKFIPYGVENNLCKQLAPTYQTLKCATGYTWNEVNRCGSAKCLKDCSFTAEPSKRTVNLSGWTGSPKSSIVTYKYGSYTCPDHYTQFRETRQCNDGSLNGTFVYTGYTQNGVVCDVVNDGTRTGIRTITGQITNATQKRTYCINYTYNTSTCITGHTYYYYQCNSGFVWSENQPKCIQCTGTPPVHSHKNNGNYPQYDTTQYYYSTDTSLPCTFSCDDGYYWSGSLNACIGNCKFTDGGEIAPNETSVVYKNPSPVCSNACESKTLTCRYGQRYEGNTIVTGYNYKNCATVNGYKLGTAGPVAGQCNVTGNSGSKGNKVFTNTTYTGGNATTVPAKQCFDYKANGKTCTDSTKYYVYYCSGTYHWETISSRILCTSDSKSVQCTQEGKPANSSYILANVTITWNVGTNAWNKAANCEWKCNGGYYRAGTSCTNCPAGSYCPAGSTGATNCPAGKYCPAGSSEPTACPSGYTSDAGAKVNTECYVSVPNGKYKTSPTGSAIQSCAAGTYRALHNSYYNSADSCTQCGIGTYSAAGASSCTGCPSGYTSLSGAKANTECYIGVAAGKYKTSPTGTATQSCVAGTYKGSHNSYYNSGDSCTQCGIGTYSAAGASSCTGCPSGYTSVAGNTGQANCYITVTAGKYLGTARGTSFTSCAAGTYKAQHNVYYGNTSSCSNCPAGKYCPAGSSEPVSCPSGYTSNANAKANTECYINVKCGSYKTSPTGTSTGVCVAGTYKSDHISYYNSSDSCTDCPAGSYCVAGSCSTASCNALGSNYTSSTKATAASSCYITCTAGKYLGTAKANSCTNCDAGKYKAQHTVNYGNTSSCECCAKGYYSSAGANTCTKCPGSMSTDSTCGSAITSCKITCSAGYYLKKGGLSCTQCPAGSKCPGGTFSYNASSDQGITQCDCGTYSTAGASTCTNCGAGKYSSAGASSCATATAGNYANSSCSQTACPSGYTSNAGAATQSDCYITVTAGNYLGTAKGTTFTQCAIGYYKGQHTVNYGGTSSCTACSAGYTTAGKGSTSSSACVPTTCPASGGCPKTDNGKTCTTYGNAVSCPSNCEVYTATCDKGQWKGTIGNATCTRNATCTSSSLLSSCPSTCNCQATTCYTQGTCANNGSKYTITSAKVGYYVNGNTCSAVCNTSSSSCNGGYTLSGGAERGYNYYCKKSGSSDVTCTCPINTIWNGTKCTPISSICNNTATNPSTQGCSIGSYSVVSPSNGYVWNCKDASNNNLNSSVCYKCSAGYYFNSSNSTCTQCSAGYYCPGGQSSSTKCSAGTYSTAGASSCSNCAAGTYSAAGASSCTNCAVGTYSSAGASSCTSCSNKPTNSSYTTNATSNSCGWQCNAGYYKNGSSCTSCSAGTYSSVGASSCSNCSVGYYSAAGASSCTSCTNKPANSSYTTNATSNSCGWQCNAGYYKNGSSCTKCSAGTYSSAGANSCSNCSVGYYSAAGASSCTSCTNKPANSSYTTNATSNSCGWQCNAGYYKNGSSCTKCSAGYYCPAGSTSQTACPAGKYSSAGASSCTSCSNKPANSSYTTNATSNSCGWQCNAGYYKNGSSCTSCGAGTYSAAGASSCTSCVKSTSTVAGTYSAGGTSSCTVCGNGKYTTAAGASSCSNCPAGSYCPGGKIISCAAGTYSAAGASSCTSCGAGTYSAAGASSCSSCTAITNMYSWTSNGTAANNCGFTCKAGYYYNGTNRTCSACSAGYTTAAGNTSINCSPVSVTCAAGKYLPKSSTTCSSCPAGSYCPGGAFSYSTSSNQGISSCPCGTYSAASASSCTSCGAGKYSSAGASSCSTASNGYYASSSCDQTACTAITNMYSWTSNGTAANNCGFTCKAGYYYNGTNRTCSACSAGYTTVAGNTSTSCSAISVTCAAGKYLPKSSTTCSSCIAGYKCPGGTYSYSTTSDQGITKCSCGTYSSAGASSCTSCGAGKYSSAGASSCSTASNGYYANSSCSQTACSNKPANSHYTSNASSNSCSRQCDAYYLPEGSNTCTAPNHWEWRFFSSCYTDVDPSDGSGSCDKYGSCSSAKTSVSTYFTSSSHNKSIRPVVYAAFLSDSYPSQTKSTSTWNANGINWYYWSENTSVLPGFSFSTSDNGSYGTNVSVYLSQFNSSTCSPSKCLLYNQSCSSPLANSTITYTTRFLDKERVTSNFGSSWPCNSTAMAAWAGNTKNVYVVAIYAKDYVSSSTMKGQLVAGNVGSVCAVSVPVYYTYSGGGGGGGGGGCFLAGTQVLMKDGKTKDIEEVEVGDVVLSYNSKTKENEYNRVTKKFIHEDIDDELYELTINGEVLKTTYAHRFYVVRGLDNGYQCKASDEWIAAAKLREGDILLMNDGRHVKIEKIEHYPYHGTLYNLGVENVNNYYVDKGYLVHNSQASERKVDVGERDLLEP